MLVSNKVRLAVDRAGGATHVAIQLNCSGTAVHAWIRNGKVSNIDKARRLAEMSGVDLLEIRPC